MTIGSKIIIVGLRAVHALVVLFVCFAWVLSAKTALWFHVILVPSLIIHWQTNRGSCILTDLEKRLTSAGSESRPEVPPRVPLQESPAEDTFVGNCFQKLTGVRLTPKVLKLVIYLVMTVSFGLSVMRLY